MPFGHPLPLGGGGGEASPAAVRRNSHSTLSGQRPAWSEHKGCGIPPRPAGATGCLLVAEELAGENHPESEESDEGSGGGDGDHSGHPPKLLWL